MSQPQQLEPASRNGHERPGGDLADRLAKFWNQILPGLVVHDGVAVRTGGQLAPAIRKNSPQLMAELRAWIAKNGERTMFGNLMVQRYLKTTKFAKSATAPEELERFQRLVDVFRKYGDQYQLDFLLMLRPMSATSTSTTSRTGSRSKSWKRGER